MAASGPALVAIGSLSVPIAALIAGLGLVVLAVVSSAAAGSAQQMPLTQLG